MIAGSDEAGKGDYFGYIVAACACCEEHLLKNQGIRDSKTLTDKKTFRLEKVIKENCITSVITISPLRYNQLHKDTGGKYNLNEILGWLHAKVIIKVFDKCKPSKMIVEKFGKEENILSNINPDIVDKITFLTRGGKRI
jgi:ribonuclease HIII